MDYFQLRKGIGGIEVGLDQKPDNLFDRIRHSVERWKNFIIRERLPLAQVVDVVYGPLNFSERSVS